MKNSTKSSKVSKSSKAVASPSNNATKKSNLRSYKPQSPSPIKFTTITPEKPPQRIRNRGVALSISEITKVAKGLQQDQKQNNETTPSQPKSAGRQISLWPSSPRKPKIADNDSSKFPEKYKILNELFHGLETLIWLSRGKRAQTFTKMKSGIEDLTGRTFKFGHLAQMKFVLPEAIVIKKIFVRDERTSCMVPDLQISLNSDGVADDAHSQGRRVLLKGLFEARVREFWESHPEGDEIPEETLPEPFNRPTLPEPFNRPESDVVVDGLKTRLPTRLPYSMRYTDIITNEESANENLSVPVKTSIELPDEHLAAPSHMLPSFMPRFSNKFKGNVVDDVEKKSLLEENQELAFPVPESSMKENPPFKDDKPHPKTSPTKLASESSESCLKVCPSLESSGASLATPMSTPVKLVSTPIRLMSATPDMGQSKKHYMSTENNTTSSLNKLARRPLRTSIRSLFDTPVKNKETVNEVDDGGLPIDDDVFDILPGNLIQSIREKESMAIEEKDPAISQAKKRKKNVARLPKLFDMIRHLLRRNGMTKKELLSKIVVNHSDCVDRGEVEEQLDLLQELAPECISEKLVSSGDLMLFLNKMESPDTIRATLVEAAK